jgi:hypothetical protein
MLPFAAFFRNCEVSREFDREDGRFGSGSMVMGVERHGGKDAGNGGEREGNRVLTEVRSEAMDFGSGSGYSRWGHD